tara:strand:+ start:204 stop:431 length:228 start_codon:yes stop_codon:yes gene_type:complete
MWAEKENLPAPFDVAKELPSRSPPPYVSSDPEKGPLNGKVHLSDENEGVGLKTKTANIRQILDIGFLIKKCCQIN